MELLGLYKYVEGSAMNCERKALRRSRKAVLGAEDGVRPVQRDSAKTTEGLSEFSEAYQGQW